MLIVLGLMVAVALAGGWLGLSRRWRWAAVAALWAGWMLLLLLLPDHAPQERAGWGALAAAVLAVLAYRHWLAGLHRRASGRAGPGQVAAGRPRPGETGSGGTGAGDFAPGVTVPPDTLPATGPAPVAASSASAPLDGAELARYSRHILLHEIGGPGQRRLKAARVLVVGAGGLGSPVMQYLAAAGVGTLGFIDDDVVEPSNLQRQVIHAEAAVGRPKVFSAADTLAAQNPHVLLRPYNRRLTDANAAALFGEYDLILDGSDSFDTRTLVNRAAVASGRPLLSGALTQWEGQVTLLDPARGAPCYACLFPERPAPGMVPTCAEAGVVGPLPGVIGTLMALEAVKELTGAGEGLRGRLLIWDGLGAESRLIRVRPRPGCPVCGTVQERVQQRTGE